MNIRETVNEMFGPKIDTKEKCIELLLFFIMVEGFKKGAEGNVHAEELLLRAYFLDLGESFLGKDRIVAIMQKSKSLFETLISEQVTKQKETSCN